MDSNLLYRSIQTIFNEKKKIIELISVLLARAFNIIFSASANKKRNHLIFHFTIRVKLQVYNTMR